jgi:two-component system, chemotaxis family, chemotaxis protein CheY
MKPIVLVVDDDQGVLKLTEFALNARGYDTHLAHDYRSGLAQACRETPDLILLDYSLPGKDGLTLLQDMRSLPDLEEVPVIMITGAGSLDVIQKARFFKVAEFVVKPFDISSLVERVLRWLPIEPE